MKERRRSEEVEGAARRCSQLKGSVIKVVIDIKVATPSPRLGGSPAERPLTSQEASGRSLPY